MMRALLAFMVLATTAYASDPDHLQDICVADLKSTVKVNGFPCKSQFNASDFSSDVLSQAGKTSNPLGIAVSSADVLRVPGLNTLGVSITRIDYAPGGLSPPHVHPRATEMIFVLYGELQAGFITTGNVLVSKTVKAGDVFVFPRGLVHFQKNNGKVAAAAIAALNSQLPGTQVLAATLFGATPAVPDNVLAPAFQISTQDVKKIKAKFAPK